MILAPLGLTAYFLFRIAYLGVTGIEEGLFCLSAAALVGALCSGGRGSCEKPAAVVTPKADPRVGELESRMATLGGSVQQLEQEKRMLQTALEESRSRASKLELQAQTQVRADAVTGELVHFMSVLQERGRFVDFLMEDVGSFGDAQIGAAARVVHQGCRQVLKDYFDIREIHGGQEGEKVTLVKGFDPRHYRLIGKVAGEPPFSGTVLHRGWRTEKVTLPRVVHGGEGAAPISTEVIAPAEIEVRP